MRGLCMMYADKQTYLTQPGPGINHPVLHLKRESQVHRRVSNLLGIRDTRKQRTLQGMNHQSFQLGTRVITDKVHHTNNSTGESIRGDKGFIGINHQIPLLPKEIQAAEEERLLLCWREERWLSTSNPLGRINHKGFRREEIQSCQEYGQKSYPVGDRTTLGRALRIS